MGHPEPLPTADWSETLMDSRRFDYWAPSFFLRRLGLRPGEVVVDVGCGPGFWTLSLADIVSAQGAVLALDASRMLLSNLTVRQPPAQVQLIQCAMPAIPLPDKVADCVWIAFTLHEIGRPVALANEIRRIVRENGQVAVLDWRPDSTAELAPPADERLDAGQVITWLRAAGFPDMAVTWTDSDAYLISRAGEVRR